MSRNRRRLPLRVLAPICALAVLALPTAAHAEVWSGADRGGDVRALDSATTDCGPESLTPEPGHPGVDITGLRVSHTRRTVVLALHLATLTRSTNRGYGFFLDTPKGAYVAEYSRAAFGLWPHPEVYADLGAAPEDYLTDPCQDDSAGSASSESSPTMSLPSRHCETPQVSLDRERDVLTLRTPRRCLEKPRWVRATAYAVDFSEATTYVDSWTPASGAPDDALLGVLGPRVRSGSR